MDPQPDRLEELLLEWEERREAGQARSAEELCADHPELLGELERRIALLQEFAQIENPAAEPAAAPRTVGDYVIKRQLGAGATGIVYLAKDRALRRKVAVKVLSPQLGFLTAEERQRFARRFEREAQTLARLCHSSIVPVYEARLDQRPPYFVMEYQPGGNLRDRMAQASADAPSADAPSADPAQIAALMAQVADAVCHAHSKGILHRDLKPSNILLDGERRPKVSDFGLAKLLDDVVAEHEESSVSAGERSGPPEDIAVTALGRQPGTPAYMAPEQFDLAAGPPDRPADVWALGAILYELLTVQRPFPGPSRTLLEQQICQQTPLAPSSIRPDADPYLARWAMRCLSRDPGKRPLAGELAGALARYRSGGPIRRFADATIEICRSLWRPAPRSNS